MSASVPHMLTFPCDIFSVAGIFFADMQFAVSFAFVIDFEIRHKSVKPGIWLAAVCSITEVWITPKANCWFCRKPSFFEKTVFKKDTGSYTNFDDTFIIVHQKQIQSLFDVASWKRTIRWDCINAGKFPMAGILCFENSIWIWFFQFVYQRLSLWHSAKCVINRVVAFKNMTQNIGLWQSFRHVKFLGGFSFGSLLVNFFCCLFVVRLSTESQNQN